MSVFEAHAAPRLEQRVEAAQDAPPPRTAGESAPSSSGSDSARLGAAAGEDLLAELLRAEAAAIVVDEGADAGRGVSPPPAGAAHRRHQRSGSGSGGLAGWFGRFPGRAGSLPAPRPSAPPGDAPILGGLPVVLVGAPLPVGAAAAAPEGAKHRRHRSLSELLAGGLKLGSRRSAPAAADTAPAPAASVPGSRAATPSKPVSYASAARAAPASPELASSHPTAAGCWPGSRRVGPASAPAVLGLALEPPPPAAAAAPDLEALAAAEDAPLLPPGVPPRGVRNCGNSCFMSALLQSLTFTPGLAHALVPDLAALVEAEAAKAAAGVAEEAPAAEEHAAAAPGEAEPAAAEAPADAAGPTAVHLESSADAAAPAAAAEPAAEGAAPAAEPPAAEPPAAERPPRGALAAAVSDLMRELLVGAPRGAAVDPSPLLALLRAHPAARDYFVGAHQQDAHEVLRVVLDLLHTDLNAAAPADGEGEAARAAAEGAEGAADPAADPAAAAADGAAPEPAEGEAARADRLWAEFVRRERSPVADAFAGQLQSAVVCRGCGARTTQYEPFLDLPLPLGGGAGAGAGGRAGARAWLGLAPRPAGVALADCLAAFAAEELLEGDEAFECGACAGRRPAVKRLRLQRLPPVLALQIKRFRHAPGGAPAKLSADVALPLRGLDLSPYRAPECAAPPSACVYDLVAVACHTGPSLHSGHYTAAVRAGAGWWHANDEAVAPMDAAAVGGQPAYVCFYRRREFGDPAAADAALAAAAAAAATAAAAPAK